MTASVIVQPERRVQRPVIPLWVHGLAMILLSATALAMLVRYCLHSYRGIRWDERLMAVWDISEQTRSTAAGLLMLITIPSVALLLAGCVAVAVLRRRLALAIGAVVLIGGATVTTQILKHAVFERLPHTGANSLPSGHTTVAISVSLAAVLVTSQRWRVMVAPAAAALSSAAGIATIIGSWHRPGDVIAALAVCTAWLGIALIVVSVGQPGPGRTVEGSSQRPWLAFTGPAAVMLMLLCLRGVAMGAGLAGLGAWLAVAVFATAVGAVFAWLTAVGDRELT